MYIVCYLVELSSALEGLFDWLRDNRYTWFTEPFDENHIEIYITEKNGAAWKAWKARELEEKIKWYV